MNGHQYRGDPGPTPEESRLIRHAMAAFDAFCEAEERRIAEEEGDDE